MKRYGDNLPSKDGPEDNLENEYSRNEKVMYGGCGVRFGTFSKPVQYTRKRKKFDLLSLLGLKRNKAKQASQ
jgi:hypothetical protein